MSVFRPFKAIKANKYKVRTIACLPYDVMNREEAKDMARGNPNSFLRVVRAEIDLEDDVHQYSQEVYLKAKENLANMINEGILEKDAKNKFYIYALEMNGRTQTGLVGCVSIDEYLEGKIKKHEFTRPEKELDRINNFDYCNANTEPVFLTYKADNKISNSIRKWTNEHIPLYDFNAVDGIRHTVWEIEDESITEVIQALFVQVECFYIADGHHRTESAVKVGKKRREEALKYNGTEAFNYFMAVVFPHNELFVMDYNRVVRDLNNLSSLEFLDKLTKSFDIRTYEEKKPYKPTKKHEFGMYLDKKWYILCAKDGSFEKDNEVKSLDASILQDNVLRPILGIEDPRTDNRIDFVGGIRGLIELENRVLKDGLKVAFSMFPTSIEDLLAVADAKKIMPPKSTWFEPKLASGLFVHEL